MTTEEESSRAVVDADGHAFTIVLEDLRSQFRVFGEALHSMRVHFDARFDFVEHEIGVIRADVAIIRADVAVIKSDVTALRALLRT